MKMSVVTVCYNSAATIAATLQSVGQQDYGLLEHLVIDGASSDTTLDVVAAHAPSFTRLMSEPDTGIYDAMNKGWSAATGDYVIFLNSDDLFASCDAVSRLAAAASASGADFILADTRFIQNGRLASKRLYSARGFRPWLLRIGVMPPHPSMAVRRRVLERLGGFDTSFRIAGDFDLIARALLCHQCSWSRLRVVTSLFRVGGASTSGWRSNLVVGRELARSLANLGQRWATLAVQLRLPYKALQFLRPAKPTRQPA